ncbi:hypothetical protein AC578_7745 [Pseudocercospora eumusae]|uniref:Uncharacterized protein n=1 Tax=Pseudocercospora eumusae TaxID=321146 RepID=A0A139HL22_9PEZI|nr:hypothetical protein AC578_7745 [Pseudocercospora eumusae]
MTTNKFFTWTKGDRKHASSSFVPIPAECITIKGLEYSRNAKGSSKANRKPLPLDFDQPLAARPSQSSRTHESIALQDAAVQSATSLMAVVSDMLKSPQLSAHLLSTQQTPTGLQPMHGRPRSRTAPSTPMFGAATMEPVELPGSTPTWHRSGGQYTDIKSTNTVTILDHMKLTSGIERPRSSPQEPNHKTALYNCGSSDGCSLSVKNFDSLNDTMPRRDGNSSFLSPQIPSLKPAVDKNESSKLSSTRPSLEMHPVRPVRHRKSASASGSMVSSRNGSSQSVLGEVQNPLTREKPEVAMRHDPINMRGTMKQIDVMRSAHESHVAALKETHERELESYRAYIALLEQQYSMASSADDQPKHTSASYELHADGQRLRLSQDSMSGRSMQSSGSASEYQRHNVEDTFVELESVRRKLSLSLKAQAQLGNVRQERDQLKDATDRSDKRISQLKDIIRKAKDGEKASRAMIGTLEAALESANMARTDTLEGFYEACEQIRRLSDLQKSIVKERDDLRRQLQEASSERPGQVERTVATSDTDHRIIEGELEQKRATLRNDPLIQQLDDLRLLVAEKDACIERLEETRPRAEYEGSKIISNPDTLESVMEQLTTCKAHLEQARADRERFDELLHSEIRRQSKTAAQKMHAVTPQVMQEASVALSDRVRRISKSSVMLQDCSDRCTLDGSKTVLLEQELKHCIQEIIMYKLDIRGYKKDLKAAHARIDAFEAAAGRPETLDSRTGPQTKARGPSLAVGTQGPIERADMKSDGLGISLQQSTPAGAMASATMSALLSKTPTPKSTNVPSESPFRPKTPLGAHKKLPKPPPQTPSPRLPTAMSDANVGRFQRQETLRSLSESIISSYAKRSPPETTVETMAQPSARGRSSDPPRRGEAHLKPDADTMAAAVPIAKYSSEMWRTPQKIKTAARPW